MNLLNQVYYFNENISVHSSVNIESTKKDEIFNEAKLELRV